MKKLFYCPFFVLLIMAVNVQAQQPLSFNSGHSHNDYKQHIPLFGAYDAKMGSIEADVFLRDGQLFVAHESKEIKPGVTLLKQYLEPLYKLYQQNGNHPYTDPKLKLQLVIDVKEDHQHVLPELLKELKPFQDMVNKPVNPNAIRIVISGDMPIPGNFKDYPELIFFDGRPTTVYTKKQLERVAMISDDIKHYTVWDGKETLTKVDEAKLRSVIVAAHQKNKPFRFWDTQDSPKTWTKLEKLGVDWINTDTPEKLYAIYSQKNKLE